MTLIEREIEQEIKRTEKYIKKHGGSGLGGCDCEECNINRARLPLLRASKAQEQRIKDLEAEIEKLKSDRDALKQAYNEVSKMDTDKAELLLDQKGDIGKLQKRIKSLEAELAKKGVKLKEGKL
jgi:predicted  nucleic acid-binding Zn-ribbon protein